MAKILIVDDEPRIRELIRAHLEHDGFVCEEASDGGAAVAGFLADKTVVFQVGADEFADAGLVVHDENFCHGTDPPLAVCLLL